MSGHKELAVGCSARRFGNKVTIQRLWTDGLGRPCADYTEYAHGVANLCSDTVDTLRHSPACLECLVEGPDQQSAS